VRAGVDSVDVTERLMRADASESVSPASVSAAPRAGPVDAADRPSALIQPSRRGRSGRRAEHRDGELVGKVQGGYDMRFSG
jgi:hypothetical protein